MTGGRDARHPAAGCRLWLAAGGLLLLALTSLFIGVADVTPSALLDPSTRANALQALIDSRLPRTAALLLTGSSLAVAGMIMQMLARNRFVEPSTAGTIEAASFGMLMMLIFFPAAPVVLKMTGAAASALVGTAFFVYLIRKIPPHSPLLVPLAGIMLGAIIGSVTAFIAYRVNLLQSLGAWRNGDFSLVISGRYEMLWLTLALTVAAYLFADRFTIAALGADVSRNLGLDYEKALAVGLTIVAAVSAIVVTTVGSIPFLGLVVPNLVSIAIGDNQRRALPWVALTGAFLVLFCDMAGRLIVYPYEIPVGTVFGVVGGLVFLYLLLRRPARAS